MRRIKIIFQIVTAFILAMLAYNLVYEPNREQVQAELGKSLPRSAAIAESSPRVTLDALLESGAIKGIKERFAQNKNESIRQDSAAAKGDNKFSFAALGESELAKKIRELFTSASESAAKLKQSTAPKREESAEQAPAAKENTTASTTLEGLRITLLDIGHGDAILLQDGKRNIMIDVGSYKPDKIGDGGRLMLERRLAELGVKRVQTVIVTHHHNDHLGSIKWFLGKYNVSNVYDNGYVNEKNPTSIWLNDCLRAGNYHNRVLRAGDRVTLDKDFYFDVLSPGSFLTKSDLENINNTSVVMMLHYGKFKMLFMGDAEAAVEDALQKKWGTALHADVLKVAHHGSKTSSIFTFLDKVRPSYALISCGDNSIYNHPNKNVVGRLEHVGAKIYTTHMRGNLTVETNGRDYSVRTER